MAKKEYYLEAKGEDTNFKRGKGERVSAGAPMCLGHPEKGRKLAGGARRVEKVKGMQNGLLKKRNQPILSRLGWREKLKCLPGKKESL